MKTKPSRFLLSLALACGACTTAGSTWMEQPLTADDESLGSLTEGEGPEGSPSDPMPTPPSRQRRNIGPHQPGAQVLSDLPQRSPNAHVNTSKLKGRVLGKFRNTYYDFPSEADFKGKTVALKNPKCETIADVPRGFFESVCVQGSGTLNNRQTVSFAKRDCSCAEKCPRTGQQICFDALDPNKFPYGRGATGQPITPLFTVAVDTTVVPLNSYIYIPEYDGVPRDYDQTGVHDGCFMAQDRGLRVKGKHVDVFTADPSITKLWNQLVPSNEGVTVVLDSPRCARATATATPPPSVEEPKKESSRERRRKREREESTREPTKAKSDSGTKSTSGPAE